MEKHNLFSAGLRFNQLLPIEDLALGFSWLKTMRETQPVFHEEHSGLWHDFRYADVQRVLTDYEQFSSEAVPGFSDAGLLSDTLIGKDPPEHRKLRGLVNVAFTPRVLEQFSGRIAQASQEALDQVRGQGRMEVVSDLAFPVPAKAIAAILGIPDEDWAIFRLWVTGEPEPMAQMPEQGGLGQRLL